MKNDFAMNLIILALIAFAGFTEDLLAQDKESPPSPAAPPPPKTWIDPDTGHRIWRLSDEPDSFGLYFNLNAYTPDHRTLVYSAPDGIHSLDLATKKTHLMVSNADPDGPITIICVGHKTNTIFFKRHLAGGVRSIYKADLDTGQVTELTALRGMDITSVNADETLAAGVYEEGPVDPSKEYGGGQPRVDRDGKPITDNLVQPANKSQMMEQRLAAKIPLILFAANIQTGRQTILLHSTDWINHLLFSPTDPSLLMYCHEGPWQKVDRIWLIRTDGTNNFLVHKREMTMEIAGHEFWGIDGKTLWYDLQTPKGEDFWLAGYEVGTSKRTRYHLQRNEWSIHFNVTEDESLFCGDGGDSGQVAKAPDGKWIELFRPELISNNGADEPDYIHSGVFHAEHLVNMARHNYKLEPNVRFSPDKKLVIFTSNMFGPSYIFGVEVDKASSADIKH